MRWLALALALVPACDFSFDSKTCGTSDNQWICGHGLACAAPPLYCGTPPPPDQCAQMANFTACSLPSVDHSVCDTGVCEPCSPDLEGCPTGTQWKPMQSTVTADLNAIWVGARGEAVAVGLAGTVLRYDGISWTAIPSPTTDPLVSVWASDPDHLFVISDAGTLYRSDQDAWTTDLTSGWKSVWGTSQQDVWAVGVGEIDHYDGANWATQSGAPSAFLRGVWGADANTVFAVGNGGDIFPYAGGTWGTNLDPLNMSALEAISGSSANDIYAVGDQPAAGSSSNITLVHYASGVWTPVVVKNLSLETLYTVWASSDVAFIGGSLGVASGSGSTWTPVEPSALDAITIHGIAGSGSDDVFAVGAAGAIWHYAPD